MANPNSQLSPRRPRVPRTFRNSQLSTLNTQPSLDIPMNPHHVWIAMRDEAPDHDPATGTESHPFDGGTPAKFDAIMQRLAHLQEADPSHSGWHIHLGPGTYRTMGLRRPATAPVSDGPLGWHLGSRWTLSGSGQDATTIQLDEWPPFLASATPGADSSWTVMGSVKPISDVLIEHLTVDGRWSTLPGRPAPPPFSPDPFVALHGIVCHASGPVTCRDVTVKGFYGKFDDRPMPRNPDADLTQPCYPLCAHPSAESDTIAPFIVERCTVRDGCGDSLTSFAAANE